MTNTGCLSTPHCARPRCSRIANTFGKVTIEWTIRSDGSVEDARVKVPSGLPRLDEAALSAVRQARFPPPPPDLSGRDLLYSNEFVFR